VSELILKMMVAGVLFGAWPLLMNRSGLSGATATAVLGIIMFLLALPVALQAGIPPAGRNWWLAIAAGFCIGLAFLAFNSGLAKATPEIVGQLVIFMVVVQMVVPAAHQAAVNGHLTVKSALGFVAAAIAAILLV
jgi:drug/metabolite transporter (DMT)-like permease